MNLDDIPAKLSELLILPVEKTPLNVKVHSVQTEDDGIILEDFTFESEPGEVVPAFLCRPNDLSTPAPALICLHGSGRSRELVTERKYSYEAEGARLHGWAREFARRGFITLSISQRTYGGRPGNMIEDAKVLLMYGKTAMGGLVWDVVRALDYLTERQDIEKEKIGCIGFSLGGIGAFYSAVVDDRIAAVVPVCGGIGRLETLAKEGNTAYHSTYFYIPGILKYFDHPDLACSIAPRALLVLARDEDVGMPLSGVRVLESIVSEHYRLAGFPEKFAVHVTHGDHNFSPEMLNDATEWFKRQMD